MDHGDIPKAAVFLSQPTGGGNSSVCGAFSAIVGWITWCISPLSSLQTDQKVKLRTRSDLNDNVFTVINLNDY